MENEAFSKNDIGKFCDAENGNHSSSHRSRSVIVAASLCLRTLSVGATTSCISSSATKTPAPRSHPHRHARLVQHKIIGNSRCVVLHVSPVTRRGAARGGSNWTNPTPPGRSDAVCEVSHDRARQCRGKRQLGTFETWCASVSICDGDKFMLLMFAPSN